MGGLDRCAIQDYLEFDRTIKCQNRPPRHNIKTTCAVEVGFKYSESKGRVSKGVGGSLLKLDFSVMNLINPTPKVWELFEDGSFPPLKITWGWHTVFTQ